jgi:hypothetical protein
MSLIEDIIGDLNLPEEDEITDIDIRHKMSRKPLTKPGILDLKLNDTEFGRNDESN